jgi:hypothetical protein
VGFGCGWAKLNVLQFGSACEFALQLFLLCEALAFGSVFCLFKACTVFRFRVEHNGLRLGEEADFEALNFLPALNLIRSRKLHLSTEPAFLPNAC